MRVPPVGSRRSSRRSEGGTPPGQGSPGERVRANGWCRAQEHTRKRRRDEPVLSDVVGRWSNTLHRPTAQAGKRRAGDRCLGTGKVRLAGSPTNPWSQCHDDVKRQRFSRTTVRNRHGCATAMSGIQRARTAPHPRGSWPDAPTCAHTVRPTCSAHAVQRLGDELRWCGSAASRNPCGEGRLVKDSGFGDCARKQSPTCNAGAHCRVGSPCGTLLV